MKQYRCRLHNETFSSSSSREREDGGSVGDDDDGGGLIGMERCQRETRYMK